MTNGRCQDWENVPDVRDGLTHKERVVLVCLGELQREAGRPHVPTAMLYGRVTEHCPISVEEMQSILQRFSGKVSG